MLRSSHHENLYPPEAREPLRSSSCRLRQPLPRPFEPPIFCLWPPVPDLPHAKPDGVPRKPLYGVGSYFQILAMQSPLPLARWLPVRARSIEMTLFLWPWSINCAWPVAMFQNWMERSFDPDTTH